MRRCGRDLTDPSTAEVWAAPWGESTWNGTRSAPFDLATAIGVGVPTVWLWPGTYDLPTGVTVPTGVKITAMPGTLAVLSGGTYAQAGTTVTLQGGQLEHVDVANTTVPPGDAFTQAGVALTATGAAVRYCTVHGGGNALVWMTSAIPSDDYSDECYGIVSWDQYDNTFGQHSMYCQNDGTKWKLTQACVFGPNQGWGWHAYTEKGAVKKMALRDTVAFGLTYGKHGPGNLVGSPYQSQSDIEITRSYVYRRQVQLNYGNKASQRLTVADCHGEEIGYDQVGWSGSSSNWDPKTITNVIENGGTDAVYVLDATVGGETGRCHIVVFNLSGTADLTVDVSDYVAEGVTGYLFDALNPLRGAVRQFTGPTVTLPTETLNHAAMSWDDDVDAVQHTAPDFAVFVVRTHGPEWTAPGSVELAAPVDTVRVGPLIVARIGGDMLTVDGKFVTLTTEAP